jgi:hypothetical protein
MGRAKLSDFKPAKGGDAQASAKSGERVQLAFRMSREDRDALVILARQKGTTAQKMLEQAVEDIFETHGRPPTG